jgi:hypothetical protein
MRHAEKPEEYRELAEKLRRLAGQSLLPNIRGDLLDLAARFERMATCFEAQQRRGVARDPGKD